VRRGESEAQHGPSKEKRTDCPLVTLGLVWMAVACAPFRMFDGNAAEGKTLAGMLQSLGLVGSPGGDGRGLAAEENLTWLRRKAIVLVVSRERERQFDRKPPSRSKPPVETHSIAARAHEAGRRFAILSLRGAAEKENAIPAVLPNVRGRLAKIATVSEPRGEKRLAKLNERIGRSRKMPRGGPALCY